MAYANFLVAAVYVFALSFAAVSDFRKLRIPNWTSALLIVLFFVYALLLKRDLNILNHVLVAVAVFVGTFILYLIRWFSAGDVKLMAAVSLWFGPEKVLEFIALTAVLGGALAITVLIVRRYPIVVQFGKVFSARDMLPGWIHHGLVPYGVAISGAGLILLPIG